MRDSPFLTEMMIEATQIVKREDILEVLKARFGQGDANLFFKYINRIEDVGLLQELLTAAATCRRVSQFRRALPMSLLQPKDRKTGPAVKGQRPPSWMYEDIFDEGQCIGARKSILQTLSVRFGDNFAAEFKDILEQIMDLKRLDELFTLSITCRRRTQFRRALT